MRTSNERGEQAFTLIELLTVTLIIGALAAIAIPTFLGQRSSAQSADAISAVRNAVVVVETYFAEQDAYPADGADLAALGAVSSSSVTLSFTIVGSGYRINADHSSLDGDGDGDPADGDIDAWYETTAGRVQIP